MRQKGPNTGKQEGRQQLRISEHSKTIKKDKKGVTGKKESSDKKAAEVSMEEGEDGMIISDAENSHMSNRDSDQGANPTDRKLIEKYEKYPEYLKVTFWKPEAFFQHLSPFNSANKYSIMHILSPKSKDTISVHAFPLTFQIQLVPELNVLTITLVTENELMSTDALLTNLTSQNDQGGQIMIEELD